MEELNVNSLHQFLAQPLWDTRNLLFRGVSEAEHLLIPSIGRATAKSTTGILRYEGALLTDFQRRALPYLPRVPASKMEWMYLAQHYGIPTRLLDWTTNPLVAMYFASRGKSDRPFAVYKLLHVKWLDDLNGTDPLELTEILAIRPPHADTRYVNQEGVFTIHPSPWPPYTPPHLVKYVVPGEEREAFQWQLRKLGYGAARIFPGLDGLAADIIQDNDLHLHNGTIRYAGDFK